MNSLSKVIVVAGPTASGKSDFAVELAHQNNGEVISADSRQVYIDLDIGTGKITKEEMKGVPHHMLNVVAVGDEFSVAEYARRALPILADILARGKTPIICGGTGQYIDALIYDIETPGVSANKQLRDELEKKDVDELYAELAEKDPFSADRVDRYNKVRLIRALEIVYELGSVPPLREPKLLYGTELIDEVKEIKAKCFTSTQMKRFGLEYEIIGKYLEGIFTLDEMKEELVTKSMQYVKRQDTWNKKYPKDTNLELHIIEVK